MSELVSVRVDAAIAFVSINNPPVNALSHAVRTGLLNAFSRIARDASIVGVVLYGEGRCFSAGGDIREFGTPAAAADPGLSKHVHPAIEQSGKTVVAAIHGFALGGGLETALACNTRVSTPDARVGLPEARIGVIPISGTQRLPRLIGSSAAIDMILNASEVPAADAPRGLIDCTASTEDLLEIAAEQARRPPAALVRDMPFPASAASDVATARTTIVNSALATNLLDAIQCGIGVSFDEGMRRARTIYDAVVDSAPSRAARERFLAGKSSDAGT